MAKTDTKNPSPKAENKKPEQKKSRTYEMVDVDISKLKLSEYNPRKMSEKEMNALKRSMTEFRCVEPIVVNKDFTVIGGHQRIVVARELKWKTIPVVFVDLPKNKEKALNLALNKIHGDWDYLKLSAILKDLELNDRQLTGFDSREVENILTLYGEKNDDMDFDDLDPTSAADLFEKSIVIKFTDADLYNKVVESMEKIKTENNFENYNQVLLQLLGLL